MFCREDGGRRNGKEDYGGGYVYKRLCFFFRAGDGIRGLVRSRGLGEVYKKQPKDRGALTWGRPWATPWESDSIF